MGALEGLVENPECPGNIQKPLPAPGILCVYLNPEESVNVQRNGEGALSGQVFPVYNGKRGFKLTWNAAQAGTTQLYGVWAYQAPTDDDDAAHA
jgi:hypothetical protein